MFFLVFLTILIQTSACPTREETITCFYEKCDINHDQKVDRDELSTAVDSYLPWYQRIPLHIFGGINQILNDCDENGDGLLTAKETFNMKKTCLNSCYKKQMTVSTFNC
jgi:Ca2+-binding EF-hand superfamily protein